MWVLWHHQEMVEDAFGIPAFVYYTSISHWGLFVSGIQRTRPAPGFS